MKIQTVTIKRFRGIEELNGFTLKSLSLIIGNNGTSKTSIIEAINYALSPSFLSGRIKHTDFFKGLDDAIEVMLKFSEKFKALLPDGYQNQEVECNGVYLRVKKRERPANGKAFADVVVVEHYVIPVMERTNERGWEIKRKSGNSFFKFDERLLSFPVETVGLPRSYYYGKNRDRQLQKGFNSSISSVYDDFNWRFLKEIRKETPQPSKFYKNKQHFEQEIFTKVDEKEVNKTFNTLNEKLKALGIKPISLSFIESNAPFDNAFLNQLVDNIEIPVSQLGSGIEMIISLLFLETLASLSKDKFIVIIDEPELHLHPTLQSKFVSYLKNLSTNIQIIVNTHSPYFYKNCLSSAHTELLVSKKDTEDKISLTNTGIIKGLFPWSPSWGEINYNAFDMPTVEFHNELYGRIQEIQNVWKEGDVEKYFANQGVLKSKNWIRTNRGVPEQSYPVTLMTYIRNSIHHPENTNNERFSEIELTDSIKNMIELLK